MRKEKGKIKDTTSVGMDSDISGCSNLGTSRLKDFEDVRLVESYSLTLTLDNGVLERPKYEVFKSRAFRVLKNGFWGFCYGDFEVEEGLRLARENIVYKGDSEVVETRFSGRFELKPKIRHEDVSLEEKVEFLREVEKRLKDEKVVSTRIVYMENVRRVEYSDSCGSELSYVVPRTGIVIQAVAKENGVMQFCSRRILKPAGYECINPALDLAEEVVRILKDLLKARLPPAGEMNVVMDPILAGVFVHEAFGHAAEADHVLQKASVLEGRLGEKIAGDNVTICDDPALPEFGYYPFDDEGVRAEKRVLVDRGVLVDYLHSRETAARLGARPGNGRAQAALEPVVRMSNTYMEAGDYSLEELLEEAKNGVFLLGTRGGETNPATGYFQFSAQYGYLIENGEIGEPVRDVALSGNTLEILRDIKLGKEVEFDPGFCGKAGQLVPVSDGAPHSLVRARVGGHG